MSRQTAAVIALSLVAAAGLLASIVAWVLLWRDLRTRPRRRKRASGMDPAHTEN